MLSRDLSCVLALDTATETVHLALVRADGVTARALGGGAKASASTLPGLEALLREHARGWPDVQAIAFGRGPGAFTGLRTACSLTQGLALGLERPVMPLDTLMAVAESARRRHPAVAAFVHSPPVADAALWVLQDARMGEIYAAPYRWSPDAGWSALAAPALWTEAHLRDQVDAGVVQAAAGSALKAFPDAVAGLTGPQAADAEPDGEALAALVRQGWGRDGACVDAALALPLYVRDKVAQTSAERSAAKGAA